MRFPLGKILGEVVGRSWSEVFGCGNIVLLDVGDRCMSVSHSHFY